jgi:lactobin A/cerein 7B family class IIb bacteriocin
MSIQANADMRDLTEVELEAISGGLGPLAAAAAFFGSWAATKVLDALGDDEPMKGPMKVVLDHYTQGGKS